MIYYIGLLFLLICHFLIGDYWFSLINTYQINKPISIISSNQKKIQSLKNKQQIEFQITYPEFMELNSEFFCFENNQFFYLVMLLRNNKNLLFEEINNFSNSKECLVYKKILENNLYAKHQFQLLLFLKVIKKKYFGEMIELYGKSFEVIVKHYPYVLIFNSPPQLEIIKQKIIGISVFWVILFLISINFKFFFKVILNI